MIPQCKAYLDDIAQDIDNVKDKRYLMPAMFSHLRRAVKHFTQMKLSDEEIQKQVEAWFEED
jgi:hypothetical protein